MTARFTPARLWTGILAVTAVQTAILGWMVWDRVSLLHNGREVVIDVVPVDPRDLFRGDYVRLGYDFARLPGSEIQGRPRHGQPVYVLLERDSATGKWRLANASVKPLPAATAPDQVVIKGRIDAPWLSRDAGPLRAPAWVQARFGIESYFLPEGQGGDLEKLVREKKVSVLVAVGDDGTAAIKAILADGQPLASEKAL